MTTFLSDERLADLERKGYAREEVEAVERWVAYCAGHVAVEPENKQALVDALRHLAPFAQIEWNAVQADEDYLPQLWTGQLGPFPLGEDAAEAYLMLTGDVLLSGADGPQVTARWMEETLDRIEDCDVVEQ